MNLPIAFLLALTTVAQAQPTPAPPAGNNFDFDLPLPSSAAALPRDDAKLRAFDERVRLRRRLLVAHQAGGFVTLGLLAATLVVGTLSYVDKYGGGDDSGRYLTPHLALASVSSLTFATTGILALVAPNPYPKPLRLDAALAHKLSMALAAACFVAQLVLGPITASDDGKLVQRPLAAAHLGIGYAAFGFMTAGTLAYVLK